MISAILACKIRDVIISYLTESIAPQLPRAEPSWRTERESKREVCARWTELTHRERARERCVRAELSWRTEREQERGVCALNWADAQRESEREVCACWTELTHRERARERCVRTEPSWRTEREWERGVCALGQQDLTLWRQYRRFSETK